MWKSERGVSTDVLDVGRGGYLFATHLVQATGHDGWARVGRAAVADEEGWGGLTGGRDLFGPHSAVPYCRVLSGRHGLHGDQWPRQTGLGVCGWVVPYFCYCVE